MESVPRVTSTTKVEFLKKLPSKDRLQEALGFKPEKFLIVYDKRLLRSEAVKKWLRDFALSYPVSAGENLKDLADFPTHVRRILRLLGPFSAGSIAIVSLGGGSVGDFTGFLASVLKRGVPYVQVPSTLLAAMDSAHGGKTALNAGGVKNQIGTFHSADSVLIVRALFDGLPQLQLQSAAGELAKMALLTGGELFARWRDDSEPVLEKIWELLPEVIEAKYRIVEKDPFEKSGERQVLNLGHSLGHVLESYYGIPHGVAVGEGLIFAVNWSAHMGYLRKSEEVVETLRARAGFLSPHAFAKKHRPMSRSRLARLIAEDKKLVDARHLNFVFLEEVGRPFRKLVPLEAFLTETQRQGWTSV